MYSIIDTKESKRQRTETICVEVTEVSVQKELQSIELTEDQTKGAESSVSTRLLFNFRKSKKIMFVTIFSSD